MPNPLRLILFVDAQNAYRGARGSFFEDGARATAGQFDPVRQGSPQKGNRRIFTRNISVWHHWLTRQDYDAVADWTAYRRR